jgi:hypothetical protein
LSHFLNSLNDERGIKNRKTGETPVRLSKALAALAANACSKAPAVGARQLIV